jgi:nucleotide-binding universal stress UspA family protein
LAILLKARVFVLSIVPEGVDNPAVLAGASGHACLIDPSASFCRMLEESIEWLKQRGVAEAQGFLASGNVTEQILAHAQRLNIDLIVLGYYPKPTGGYWWAGAQRKLSLAERAKCCILVAVEAEEELKGLAEQEARGTSG